MPQVLERPRLFKCPYCTKAKLVKKGGGNLDPREVIVPNQALSRYLWVFPIKDKSPPIDIINKFLKKYGIKTGNKTITTTPQGYLSKLNLFRDNATEQEYSIEDREMNDLFNINPSDLYCSIRTDGGKEFMAKSITETIENHGYHHEKTAADTSFQNGIVE